MDENEVKQEENVSTNTTSSQEEKKLNICGLLSFIFSLSWGKIKFSTTPTMAASPMPERDNSPQVKVAPPIPIVRVNEKITIFRM